MDEWTQALLVEVVGAGPIEDYGELAATRFVREMNAYVRDGKETKGHTLVALNVLTALNLKNHGFRHERETRCVVLCAGMDLQHMPQIPEKTIVPWKASPGFGEKEPSPLPVTEVMIGPRTPPEAAGRVREAFLSSALHSMPTSRSSLPFR